MYKINQKVFFILLIYGFYELCVFQFVPVKFGTFSSSYELHAQTVDENNNISHEYTWMCF